MITVMNKVVGFTAPMKHAQLLRVHGVLRDQEVRAIVKVAGIIKQKQHAMHKQLVIGKEDQTVDIKAVGITQPILHV
jgi:hypothetical protein